MDGLMTIGKICAETGMSTSKLRYYESLGLIQPAFLDEKTGYRYYSLSQYREIEILKLCAQMNFPLKKIKELKDCGDIEAFYDFIKLQKFRARKAVREAQAVCDNVEWMYEEMADYLENPACSQRDTPYLRSFPSRQVMMVHPEESDPANDILAQDDSLTRALTVSTADEFVAAPHIRRQYGYQLDADAFLHGTLQLVGKYAAIDRFSMHSSSKLTCIPAGEYLCMDVHLFAPNRDWIHTLRQHARQTHQTIRDVYARELFFNFLDRNTSLIRVECLLENE
ncbi:MAG: MerR family transcriptional regulator [Butyricicoccus sp.]